MVYCAKSKINKLFIQTGAHTFVCLVTFFSYLSVQLRKRKQRFLPLKTGWDRKNKSRQNDIAVLPIRIHDVYLCTKDALD